MPNPENLIPASQRSPSEARENGRKGGKASGKTRRRKADAKKVMQMLCSLPINEDALSSLSEIKSFTAAKDANFTLFEYAALNLLHIAAQGNGSASIKAFEMILKVLGQYPSEGTDDTVIKLLWGGEDNDNED